MEKFKELIKEYREDFKNFFPIKDNKSDEDIIKEINLLLEKYNNIVDYSKKFINSSYNFNLETITNIEKSKEFLIFIKNIVFSSNMEFNYKD